MNRRSLLSLIGSLPIVGALVKPADGVALRSTSHPIGAGGLDDVDLGGIVDAEITLTRYAAAGEQVFCENGHLICEFVVDVHVGETQDLPRQIGHWTQEAPQVGQLEMPLCAVCGAWFYTGGGIFHFKDGWRHSESRPLMVRR